VLICLLLSSCAGQELANIGNQEKHECKKIYEWGENAAEIIENTEAAMDNLDEDIAFALQATDQEERVRRIRTIEEKLNSIGQALYSIDISEPIRRAQRIEQCANAIIEFTGKTPEHADDNTLALHIFRLKEAQLKLEKLRTLAAKTISSITTVVPGAGWLDHIWKIVLGAYSAYTTFRGLQENKNKKKERSRADKAERNFGYTVEGIRKLKTKNATLYETMKDHMTDTVPKPYKDEFDAEVARVVNRIG
jgi:hypothetical protein